MSNTAHELALINLAARKKCRVEQLSDAEIALLSISNRTVGQVITDGLVASTSFVKTQIARIRVPLFVYSARKQICLSCPRHGISAGGRLFCKECLCTGVLMESALQDGSATCRLPPNERKWGEYVSMTKNGLPINGSNIT